MKEERVRNKALFIIGIELLIHLIIFALTLQSELSIIKDYIRSNIIDEYFSYYGFGISPYFIILGIFILLGILMFLSTRKRVLFHLLALLEFGIIIICSILFLYFEYIFTGVMVLILGLAPLMYYYINRVIVWCKNKQFIELKVKSVILLIKGIELFVAYILHIVLLVNNGVRFFPIFESFFWLPEFVVLGFFVLLGMLIILGYYHKVVFKIFAYLELIIVVLLLIAFQTTLPYYCLFLSITIAPYVFYIFKLIRRQRSVVK